VTKPASPPVDRFHAYLDYCENVELVSVGDYVEKVARGRIGEWTRLMADVWDTYRAGLLEKVPTANGGVAYVRKTSSHSDKTKRKEPHHGNVR
jgi:hypothetical protein